MDRYNWDLKQYLWRRKIGENRIRILPPKSRDHGLWSLRVNIHAVEIYNTEKIICNEQLFKKPCRLCELWTKFKNEKKDKEAKRIGLRKYMFLNIIDRAREDEGAKVWMAPISAWWQIEKVALSKKKVARLFDSPAGNGCDFQVSYDPDAPFKSRYKVYALLADPIPLGSEEQKKKWEEQIMPFEPENFYDVVGDKELWLVEDDLKAEAEDERMRELRELIHRADISPAQKEEAQKELEGLVKARREVQRKIAKSRYDEQCEALKKGEVELTVGLKKEMRDLAEQAEEEVPKYLVYTEDEDWWHDYRKELIAVRDGKKKITEEKKQELIHEAFLCRFFLLPEWLLALETVGEGDVEKLEKHKERIKGCLWSFKRSAWVLKQKDAPKKGLLYEAEATRVRILEDLRTKVKKHEELFVKEEVEMIFRDLTDEEIRVRMEKFERWQRERQLEEAAARRKKKIKTLSEKEINKIVDKKEK